MDVSIEEAIVEKLRQLPSEQLAEVQNFVDFLVNKSHRRAALDRLLAVAPALEAAGAEPMSDEAILFEVESARAAELHEAP